MSVLSPDLQRKRDRLLSELANRRKPASPPAEDDEPPRGRRTVEELAALHGDAEANEREAAKASPRPPEAAPVPPTTPAEDGPMPHAAEKPPRHGGWMTAKEVARALDTQARTIWRWEMTGKIPAARRIGRKWVRWDRSELEAFIATRGR